MTNLPEPLVPAEVDLRDFQFMPLDVGRLRDSDLASLETPEVCWSALLLWCASWHQQPAASLPDDDRVLAKFAGYGRVIAEWQRVRDGALRNWVKCSDGRLYHPVVAEKAMEAWQSKLEQRWMTECGRIRKHNQRHGTSIRLPSLEEWLSSGRPTGQPLPVQCDNVGSSNVTGGHVSQDEHDASNGTKGVCPNAVPRETHSKGQGQGQGQGQGYSELRTPTAAKPPRAKRNSHDPDPEWLAEFKREYPDRCGGQEWRKAVRAANARIAEGHTPAEFIDGAKRYHAHIKSIDKVGTQYVKQAASFLGPDKHFLQAWPVAVPRPARAAPPPVTTLQRFPAS